MPAPPLVSGAFSCPRARGKAGEAGYNMVILVVAVTILNIMVAVALPLMSTAIQRQKEEELVFRGFQYAEAIRTFNKKFQRYPVKLTELLETKPRCIRQLWKDPMTKDGKWGLIFQNQGTPLTVQPPGGSPPPNGPAGQQTTDLPAPGNDQGQQDAGNGGADVPKNGEVVATGPIVGVYSKSPKTSHLIFYGHQRYDEWRFTDSLLTGAPPGGGNGIAPRPGGQVAFSVRWLGRPMQFVDQAQPLQNGSGPGGSGPSTNGNGGATSTSAPPNTKTSGQP
jgi:type II secretory pathway pseudopilin PulG